MNNTKSITPPLGQSPVRSGAIGEDLSDGGQKQRGGRKVSIWGQVKKALASVPGIWEEVRDEAHGMDAKEVRLFLLAILAYVRFDIDLSDILETFPMMPAKVRYFETRLMDIGGSAQGQAAVPYS